VVLWQFVARVYPCFFQAQDVSSFVHALPLGPAGVAAWAIEQLGQHSEDTAGPLITAGALMALAQVYCRWECGTGGSVAAMCAMQCVHAYACTSMCICVYLHLCVCVFVHVHACT